MLAAQFKDQGKMEAPAAAPVEWCRTCKRWPSHGSDRVIAERRHRCESGSRAKPQKSPGVHKILVRKILVPPPPPTPKKGTKIRKKCTNQRKILKIDTFSGGGGSERNFIDKTIYGHLGVSEQMVLLIE